jgi:hypothetical protein
MKLLSLVLLLLILTACGAPKTINNETYGILTTDSKDPNIQYLVVKFNVIWVLVLCETIIVPIYVFVFDLYEPVGLKKQVAIK